jgi:cathepsin B
MKFLIIALLVACALAEMHPVNHQIVAEIKEKATWTPMEVENNPFAFMPIEQIKAMMGTKLVVAEDTGVDLGFEADAEFDARTQWPDSVGTIRDQQQCGSCWAFGATEALADRFGVEQDVHVTLSPQQLVSCDTGNFGCQGGYLNKAWDFMAKTGVMTDECYTYTSGDGNDGKCQTTCDDGSAPTYYHAGKYTVTGKNSVIKQQIQQNGPVEAAFTVYQDFMSYSSGTYKHTSGSALGGHAIKALGWGTDKDGVDYWIMANSWNTVWGMEGFFNIAQGDCGIDSQMTFGLAATTTQATE